MYKVEISVIIDYSRLVNKDLVGNGCSVFKWFK